jgi:hypothetical protein
LIREGGIGDLTSVTSVAKDVWIVAGWDIIEPGSVVELDPAVITGYRLAESPSKSMGSRESSGCEGLLTGGAEVSVAAVACLCTLPRIYEREDNTAAGPGEVGRREILWRVGVEP